MVPGLLKVFEKVNNIGLFYWVVGERGIAGSVFKR